MPFNTVERCRTRPFCCPCTIRPDSSSKRCLKSTDWIARMLRLSASSKWAASSTRRRRQRRRPTESLVKSRENITSRMTSVHSPSWWTTHRPEVKFFIEWTAKGKVIIVLDRGQTCSSLRQWPRRCAQLKWYEPWPSGQERRLKSRVCEFEYCSIIPDIHFSCIIRWKGRKWSKKRLRIGHV